MVFNCNIFPLSQELKSSVVLCVEGMTVFGRIEQRGQPGGEWSNNELQELIAGRGGLSRRRHRNSCGMRPKQTKQNWQGMAPGARQNQGVTQGTVSGDRECGNPVVCRWLTDLWSGMKWPEHPIKERSVWPWHLG